MKFNISNRQFISAVVIFFYVTPVFFFAFYSIGLMSRHKSWSILSLGFLIMTCGALALILLLSYWEQVLKEKIQRESSLFHPILKITTPPPVVLKQENKVTALDLHLTLSKQEAPPFSRDSPKEEIRVLQDMTLQGWQDKYANLIEEMQIKNQSLDRLEEENQTLLAKANQAAQDFADYKIFSEEQLKQKSLHMSTLQQTIENQRTEMEKHQEQIHLLDTKVHNLSYEIKTLLYLHDKEEGIPEESPKTRIIAMEKVLDKQTNLLSESQVQTSHEATALLRRCIHMAQKFTGARYYGNELSRYRELSLPHYTIDQRRLFDSLRQETDGLIFVYSQQEQKLLFINNQSKILLGWSPEKMIEDFPNIIQEGAAEWKRALEVLISSPEHQMRLLMKTRNGPELLLHCQLGCIPIGLFRNYIIGILYTPSS